MRVLPGWILMLLAVIGLAPAAPVTFASEVLVDPAPIAVPEGLTEKAVGKSIRTGIAGRGWVVSRSEAGFMEATLNLRSHMAKVGITYDTKTIQIRYLESTNLDYAEKKGVRRIHGNYLKWINNMVRDINLQLQAAAADLADATEATAKP